MELATPQSGEELAALLAEAAAAHRTVNVGGQFSKNRMGGPVHAADLIVSTSRMRNVLQYEPRDLTVSVQAGMPLAELNRLLGENGQMIPLDPVWAADGTVGGVLAANCSGSRRRLYGTARDIVIGMQFATLEGKLVQSGGMVVKNVAGLDMSKLLIGSFGTLAAITVVNFKLFPKPPGQRSYLLRFDTAAAAGERAREVLGSVLQPVAIDLFNPAAAEELGVGPSWVLAIQAAGTEGVLARYDRELSGAERLEGGGESVFWDNVREFGPNYIGRNTGGAVVRLSRVLTDVAPALNDLPGPGWARAGSGVCYGAFAEAGEASRWMQGDAVRRNKAVFEIVAENRKPELDLWPDAGPELELMQKIKQMFDPSGLLNRRRLYGRF